MPQQGTSGEPPERRYDETVHPDNPPNAVLQPDVRSAALGTYLGGIIAFFVIVGVGLIYWSSTDRSVMDDWTDPAIVGTTGQRPGGGDPSPQFGDTTEELELRGGSSEPTQGPMPSLGTAAALTGLRQVNEQGQAAAGRRIDIRNVAVESREGDTLWIEDAGTRAAVVAAAAMPDVQAGSRIDVSGRVETVGQDAVRIRAERIDLRE